MEVEHSIKNGISEYEKLYKKRLNFYMVTQSDTKLKICVLNDKIPTGLKYLIDKTNRFVKIGNYSIPIIFESDFGSLEYKKISKGPLLLGGYLVQYDYKGKVVYEGIIL